MTTTIYPNSGVVFKIKEILNTVLDGADLTGINSYSPEEVLNMVFDEANVALKVKLTGGTPTVDAITIAEGTQPTTPASGYAVIWFDTSDNHLKTIDDTGAVIDLTATGSSVATNAKDFTLNDAPGTPSAGDYREYYDSDGVRHVLDSNGDEVANNIMPEVSGSGGSVAVIENVESATLYNQLFGKLFDKNVLLRDGDDVPYTTDATIGTPDGGS